MKRPPIPAPVRRFAVFLIPLTLVFGAGWIPIAQAGMTSGFNSYAVAIPFICAWLLWQRLSEFPTKPVAPAKLPATLLGIASAACAIVSTLGRNSGWFESPSSWIALQMLGWVFGTWAGAFWFFGSASLRNMAFPWAYLIFTAPPPTRLLDLAEAGLQHASADSVEMVFRIGQVSYLRESLRFWLPNLVFDVAPECSGIRATVVLFLTSLLGAYLILRSPWRRAVLVLLVIPLGIARNTLRICTITLLTAFVDSRIIDGPLHHKGGPLFFAVSLIPFFAVLAWFRHQETRAAKVTASARLPASAPPTRAVPVAAESSSPSRTP